MAVGMLCPLGYFAWVCLPLCSDFPRVLPVRLLESEFPGYRVALYG